MFTAPKNAGDIRQAVVELKDDVQETARKAGQKAREFYDAASHEVRDVSAAAEKQIRSHPIAASAIAGAFGFLLGALFRR